MTSINPRQGYLLWGSHVCAGVAHIASAVTLYALAFREDAMWRPVLRRTYEVWTLVPGCAPSGNVTDECFELSRGAITWAADIVHLLFLFGFWSGVIHLVTALPQVWPRYLQQFAQRYSLLRWTDYIVSSTLMIVVIALYAGVDDALTLVGIGLSQATTIFLGGLSERCASLQAETPNGVFGRAKWITYAASNVMYIVGVWVPILVTFITSLDHIENPDVNLGLIRGIIAAIALVFSSFGLIFFAQLTTRVDYGMFEVTYLAMSLTAKLLLTWVLFFALFQRSATLSNDVYKPPAKIDLDADALTPVLAGVTTTGILLAVLLVALWRTFGKMSPADTPSISVRAAAAWAPRRLDLKAH